MISRFPLPASRFPLPASHFPLPASRLKALFATAGLALCLLPSTAVAQGTVTCNPAPVGVNGSPMPPMPFPPEIWASGDFTVDAANGWSLLAISLFWVPTGGGTGNSVTMEKDNTTGRWGRRDPMTGNIVVWKQAVTANSYNVFAQGLYLRKKPDGTTESQTVWSSIYPITVK